MIVLDLLNVVLIFYHHKSAISNLCGKQPLAVPFLVVPHKNTFAKYLHVSTYHVCLIYYLLSYSASTTVYVIQA